jgi:DNA-binding CsgD family transcriptional regulator
VACRSRQPGNRAEASLHAPSATGRSNKQIADALFVTVNTVEGHLSRAYAKLGIRSRAQLASLARDHWDPRQP